MRRVLKTTGCFVGTILGFALLVVAWASVAYIDRELFDSDLLGYRFLRDPVTGCEWVRVGQHIYQKLDVHGEPVCAIYGGGSSD